MVEYGLYVLVFLVGMLAGGLIVAAMRPKDMHGEDIEEMCARMEQMDNNMIKVNNNFRKAVQDFGDFYRVLERRVANIDQHVSSIDAGVMTRLSESEDSMLEAVDSLNEAAKACNESTEATKRALTRLILCDASIRTQPVGSQPVGLANNRFQDIVADVYQ